MEAVVFHNPGKPQVGEKLKSFVVVQLHCDHKDKAKKAFALSMQDKLVGGDGTQPQYVIVDPRRPGEWSQEHVLRRWAYNVDHQFWLTQLDDALAAYAAVKHG